MEENKQQCIQLQILGISIKLFKADFISFKSFVTSDHLVDIKIVFANQQLQKERLSLINVFIYYIISIQKNFKVFKNDMNGNQFKKSCTKKLCDYYVKNQMNIQLYEFSYICSKLLNIKIQQCAHIIYYLIYGRFASYPYINSICNKKNSTNQQKNIKRRQTYDNLMIFKSSKHKTSSQFTKQINFQLDNFSKQLKKNLQINIKPSKFKSYSKRNISCNNQNNSSQVLSKNNDFQNLYQQPKGNVYISQRVQQRETSLIFSAFNKNRSPTYAGQNWNKIGFMRKQKFDDFFSLKRYKIKSELTKNNQQIRQNFERSILHEKNKLLLSENKYQNFKQVSKELKANIQFLDKIRSQCSLRRKNKYGQISKNQNSLKSSNLSKSYSVQFKIKNQGLNQNTFNFLSNQENKKNINYYSNSAIQQISSKPSTSKKLLSKQKSASNKVQLDIINKNPSPYIQNLLREDLIDNSKQNIDDQKFQYYSQTINKLKKVNTKGKLQKYKKQFRKFTKTQMLDRIKQATS